MNRRLWIAAFPVVIASALPGPPASTSGSESRPAARKIEMQPIGTIHKENAAVWIEIDGRFEDGLLGIEDFSHVWVFWWLDRNDIPARRNILQVYPRGDRRNPLTGVFATRSPFRPNLIAQTLCRVKQVEGNRLHVEDIDAFDNTPVIDLKPYLPDLDRAEDTRVPDWAVHKR